MRATGTHELVIDTFMATLRGRSGAIRCRETNGLVHAVKPLRSEADRKKLALEYAATQLYTALGFPVPSVAPAKLSSACLGEAAGTQSEQTMSKLAGETHLAIAYPVDPSAHVVYDLLPPSQGPYIVNRNCFQLILFADIWMGHIGCRQAVFCDQKALNREALQNSDSAHLACEESDSNLGSAVPHRKFFGVFIGNSSCFGSGQPPSRWHEREQQYYPQPWSPQLHPLDAESMLQAINTISSGVIDECFASIPQCWMSEELENEITVIKEVLSDRSNSIHDLCRSLLRKQAQSASSSTAASQKPTANRLLTACRFA